MNNIPPSPVHIVGFIGNVQIAITPDPAVKPGHQIILLSNNEVGHHLAESLFPEQLVQAVQDSDSWIRVPHTAEVDQVLISLIDLAAEIRRQAPRLVQLSVTGLDSSLDRGEEPGHGR